VVGSWGIDFVLTVDRSSIYQFDTFAFFSCTQLQPSTTVDLDLRRTDFDANADAAIPTVAEATHLQVMAGSATQKLHQTRRYNDQNMRSSSAALCLSTFTVKPTLASELFSLGSWSSTCSSASRWSACPSLWERDMYIHTRHLNWPLVSRTHPPSNVSCALPPTSL